MSQLISSMKNKFTYLLKEFWQKRTIGFSVLRLVLVLLITLPVVDFILIKTALLPEGFIKVPMRCQNGIVIIPHQGMSASPTQKCYSVFNKEFWNNSTWELEYKSVFSQENSAALALLDDHPKIITAHPSYPADYSDNTILIGAAHNVFVGKVIAQVGSKDFVNNPATQFSVEVISNIKGELKDAVVVNQEGGYKDGTLYLMDDSTGLLQLGATYLFATRYDAENDYYTLNPHPNASKLLSSDGAESDADLKTLADKDEKVKVLEAAYPDEQLLEADVYHSNTGNDYKSLPADKKAAAQARADSAKASLDASAQAQ